VIEAETFFRKLKTVQVSWNDTLSAGAEIPTVREAYRVHCQRLYIVLSFHDSPINSDTSLVGLYIICEIYLY